MKKSEDFRSPNSNAGPTVLWWSHSGRDYSRDRIVRKAFGTLGWSICDYVPKLSPLGDVEARLRRIAKPDLVWVPCFRQRDAAAAQRWAMRYGVPLILDPLISAWDKQVFERRKFAEHSGQARRLLRWESLLFQNSTTVIADTTCHARFFCESLGVSSKNVAVIPVSAEEDFFSFQPRSTSANSFHVMFYGSFIGLQGPQFIAEAARRVPEAMWTFIGGGPLLDQCRSIADGLDHVKFIPRVPYRDLPKWIGQADVLCGVFGTSPKASRVIPNKVFQSMACGRSVITQTSDAYPRSLASVPVSESGLKWVSPGSALEIANAVRFMAGCPQRSVSGGNNARRTFEQFFSNDIVTNALGAVLQKTMDGGLTSRRRAA